MTDLLDDLWRRYTVNPLGLNPDGRLITFTAADASGASRADRLRVLTYADWVERNGRNTRRVRWPKGVRIPRPH